MAVASGHVSAILLSKSMEYESFGFQQPSELRCMFYSLKQNVEILSSGLCHVKLNAKVEQRIVSIVLYNGFTSLIFSAVDWKVTYLLSNM